jgi:hypothetical protein
MKRKLDTSDLTRWRWNRLIGPLTVVKPGGRPRSVDLGVVVNGNLHVVCGGCAWRWSVNSMI